MLCMPHGTWVPPDKQNFFKAANKNSDPSSSSLLCLSGTVAIIDCRFVAISIIVSPQMQDQQANPPAVMARTVSFHTVQIREFAMILGDNPGTPFGPPLAMDWDAQASYELPFEDYEATKPAARVKSQCALPPSARIEILRRSGYSRNEITALTKPVNQARARRRATLQQLQLAPIQELIETVARKGRNVISLGRRKRKEREYLERATANSSKENVAAKTFPTAASTEEDNSSGGAADAGIMMGA